MYGRTYDGGEPFYDAVLTGSAPAKIESESHVNGSVVTALVDNRASGHCLDDLIRFVL